MTVVPIQSFFPWVRYFPTAYIQDAYRGIRKLIEFSESNVRSFIKNVDDDPEYAKGTFLRNLVDAEDIETGSKLSFEDLVENSILFIIGGTDTVGVTTVYAIWECGKRDDVRAKLVQEIRAAFPDPGERPTFEKASELPYLDAVIQETLRLRGPLRSAFPRVSPGRTISGHYVPKGTIVSTSAHVTGMDPESFPDPETFSPERWIGGKQLRGLSRPFSHGPRNCIGKNLAEVEMTLTLARIYQLYDIANDSSMTDEMMGPRDRGVTYPRDAKLVIRPTAVSRQ